MHLLVLVYFIHLIAGRNTEHIQQNVTIWTGPKSATLCGINVASFK